MSRLEQPQNLAFDLTEMAKANTDFINTVYTGRHQLVLMALNEHGIARSTCLGADQLLYVVTGRIGVTLGDMSDQTYELGPGTCIHIPASTPFRITTSPHPNQEGGVDYAKLWICYSSPVFFGDDMHRHLNNTASSSTLNWSIGAKNTPLLQKHPAKPVVRNKVPLKYTPEVEVMTTPLIGSKSNSGEDCIIVGADDVAVTRTKVMNGNQEWLKIMQQREFGKSKYKQ